MAFGVARFEEFELDCGRYELRRGDCVVRLEKIPMEILTLLVESGGQLVSRDQIIEKVWGKDVFLDTEHGINTAVRKIRQALGDDPDQPRFVQTVSGKGYRFVAPVVHAAANRYGGNNHIASVVALSSEAPPSIVALRATGPTGRKSHWVLASVGAAILVLIVGLNVRGLRDRLWSSAAKPRIQSLAVLPLENLSGDPSQDFFADGMTDELITMLAKNTGLRVISRTSTMQYKGVHRPLPEIARELHVDGVVEGSLSRTSREIHMTVQLVNGANDTHVWAESYDRPADAAAALPDEISRVIAVKLQSVVNSARPARLIRADAHEAVLRGRYFWFAGDYGKSKQYFQQAIDLQSEYAEAWAGLAETYSASAVTGDTEPKISMPLAEVAARRALDLDDTLAEAHNAAAANCLFYRWDWDCADRESLRAIQLNPGESELHHLRAKFLLAVNRADEAVREQQIATELDPFARPWALGFTLLAARRFDATLEEALVRSKGSPNDASVHLLLASLYRAKHMWPEWEKEVERCDVLWEMPDWATKSAEAFRRGGYRASLEAQRQQFRVLSQKQYVSYLDFAWLDGTLQLRDRTMDDLEKAYANRDPEIIFIQSDFTFDFLHNDSGYMALMKKIGLPQSN